MMAGYVGAPDLTRSSFRGKYFRTGDIARVGPDGAVYLSGRSKDLIVRGGNKVSPIEVDGALMQHPQVLASLTTGVPDAVMGERIHSLVVAQDGCGLTELQLRDWARSKLDKFKLPDRIHFGAKIPQGRTGKDDRKALWHWLTEQNLVKPVSTQERD
jgi:acyl-coenzyme A synthetase/AMP-(fatty) acid ligase